VSGALSVVTSPLRLKDRLTASELVVMVAGDALRRHAEDSGRPATLLASAFPGELATHHGFGQELAREGHDRATVDRGELAARYRTYDGAARSRARSALAEVGVEADLDPTAAHAGRAVRAARTAFVRLYDEGLLQRVERVEASCPSCATVLDGAAVEPAVLDAQVLTVRLPVQDSGSQIDVRLVAPELLGGVVALTVPDGHPAAGGSVCLPVDGRLVPVLVDPSCDEPRALVPGHEAGHLDLARLHALEPVVVFETDGVVRLEGPLKGLHRYAARQAARSMLEGEGALVAWDPASEPVGRCRCCGTVVVPHLAAHWFLPTRDMEVKAADAIREGDVAFSPAGKRAGA
jgi:valyl-tRNA synthetase